MSSGMTGGLPMTRLVCDACGAAGTMWLQECLCLLCDICLGKPHECV